LQRLEQEIQLIACHLDPTQKVEQLHFGGGTPTFLSHDELRQLMAQLRKHFNLLDDDSGDYGIEIDPREADWSTMGLLRELGFNRVSIGLQDLDPAVQRAVNRLQSLEETRAVIDAARTLQFRSINIDLIYGLPLQTPESFARTIAQVGELRPDRIALYAYAHLPQRFKPQRRIAESELPSAAGRVAMLGDAIGGLLARGYRYIGMDHFALPSDALAVAKDEGRLHRNFQGYSTQPDRDLVALGVSAIGRIGRCYYQNAKTLPEYYESLASDTLPVVRGHALTEDDVLRRDVIMALMCQGRVRFAAIEAAHDVRFGERFAAEMEKLRDMAAAGLVELDADGIRVTASGWFLVRAVAMVFDSHLQASRERRRFSRVV
jgi:oxygen-independent coproporphyrinogen-3 oxidase